MLPPTEPSQTVAHTRESEAHGRIILQMINLDVTNIAILTQLTAIVTDPQAEN